MRNDEMPFIETLATWNKQKKNDESLNVFFFPNWGRRPGKTSLGFLGNTFHCWSLTSRVKKSKKNTHADRTAGPQMIISAFFFPKGGPSFRKRCQQSFPCTCHLACHLKRGRNGRRQIRRLPPGGCPWRRL